MRIDLMTPMANKPEEKKEAKVIKATSPTADLFVKQTQLEDNTKNRDSTNAQIISFLEERKKRRAKVKSIQLAKYLKIIEDLADKGKNEKGLILNKEG